ncbi:cysteine synthase A [bacterium]|nr:cysteine synthase A [candidate division CSSED10-310 bacterium]
MEKVYQNITQCIGNTPLVALPQISRAVNAEILAKCEFFNPGASIKDRTALSLVSDAEKRGLLTRKSVIVEPTSGNTGIALAMICAVKGYSLIITMPETMSIERRKLLKFYGARLVLTDGSEGMHGAVAKAIELVKNNPNYILLNQFENPANPLVHETTTAREIINDTGGRFDILVCGVGTGGTITGLSRYLKPRIPELKIIAVEPADSAVLSGKKPGAHKLQGIGAGFIPEILQKNCWDNIVTVHHEDAKEACQLLAKKEGILAGISSGAALWAAMAALKSPACSGKRAVVIFPDTGERYLSTWLFD